MRTIIYGDVHGCLDELNLLRQELRVTTQDREISVGDILDRGPYSNETLRYVREHNIELVMGNHEYKYLRYYKHQLALKQSGKKNPIFLNDEKIAIYENLSQEDIDFLYAAPFYIKEENLTVVHAGITNKIILEKASKKELESLTRTRMLSKAEKTLVLGQEKFGAQFWSKCYDGSEGIIVYGHEVFSKVNKDKYSFGIDTGCVYGDKLTALIVYNTQDPLWNYDIVSVEAFKKYSEKKVL